MSPQTGPASGSSLADDVIAKGFVPSMFGLSTSADLTTMVDGVVASKQLKVQAEVGAAVFNSTNPMVAAAVNDAVVWLSTWELWGRRGARVLGSAVYSPEMRVRPSSSEKESAADALAAYQDAELLALTLFGATPGFSPGAEISTHFMTDAEPLP